MKHKFLFLSLLISLGVVSGCATQNTYIIPPSEINVSEKPTLSTSTPTAALDNKPQESILDTTTTTSTIPLTKLKMKSTDTFTYSDNGKNHPVFTKKLSALEFLPTAEVLESLSQECGTNKDAKHFQELLNKFKSQDKVTQYTFGKNWKWTISIAPNKIGYTDEKSFRSDFDICAAGGDAYPFTISPNYISFTSSCGSGGALDEEDIKNAHECVETQEIIEQSLKLK